MIRPEQMPYKNPLGQTYDSGAFEKILDQGLALADWNGFAARRAESKARGLLRGRGIASFLEWTGGNALEEKVSVDVTPDGIIEIFSATQAMGQGIATSYAQLAVDVFGVPIDKIRIVQGDTARGNGFGSAGSRSLFTGGSAVQVASERTVDHAKTLAGEALEAAAGDIEYRAGRFAVVGTDVGIDLFALAGKQPGTAHPPRGVGDRPAGRPGRTRATSARSRSIPRAATSASSPTRRSTTSAASSARRSRAARSTAAPCRASARRSASRSSTTKAAASSSPAASWTTRCRAPTSASPSAPSSTPRSRACSIALGVKGVGELGTIGATPAAMNAVIDALDHAGLGRAAETLQMPATSERVWQMLRSLSS